MHGMYIKVFRLNINYQSLLNYSMLASTAVLHSASLEVLGRPVLVCLGLLKSRINSTHRTLSKCWSVTVKFFNCVSLARATRMQKDNTRPLLNSVPLIYITVLATQNDNFPNDTGLIGILLRVWYEE